MANPFTLERFDGIPIGWHRTAVRLYGERAEEALDALVARGGPRVPWPGVAGAVLTLRLAAPSLAVVEPSSVLPPAAVHFCGGASCPGLPYRDSETPHPSWCAESHDVSG